ncbi:histidine kinase [Paenibacillus sp. HB172176]|uniref:sensor histidine kinase n=1 Tax=Paenibacillus sp. HB172176 TaxID=2493690 RepID=UPI0014399D22|nr:histidine kinase [Paenibacillus sp. HB172176]
MEQWAIGNKAAILFYVIQTTLKRALIVSSVCYVCFCLYALDPLFALLLPVHAYEWTSLHKQRRLYALLAMLVPILLIPSAIMKPYAMAASLSCLLYASVDIHSRKLAKLEDDHERLRMELQQLRTALSESNAYLQQSSYTSKLEERNRLSQQIHDEIGHSMAGALIQMEASRRLLDTNKPGKASELLGNAIAISKDGLEQIRLTLKAMKPKSEELGINRLRLFSDGLGSKHAIASTLTHEGDLELISPLQWKIIHENAVEAATNAMKYASATAIHMHVQVLHRFVKSVVEDNGVGADKVVKGLGIIGMEERAAAMGGTVLVDGSKGFRVTTLLPRGDAT